MGQTIHFWRGMHDLPVKSGFQSISQSINFRRNCRYCLFSDGSVKNMKGRTEWLKYLWDVKCADESPDWECERAVIRRTGILTWTEDMEPVLDTLTMDSEAYLKNLPAKSILDKSLKHAAEPSVATILPPLPCSLSQALMKKLITKARTSVRRICILRLFILTGCENKWYLRDYQILNY